VRKTRPDQRSPGHALGLDTAEFRGLLDALAIRYDRSYLDTDPLGIVRRYDRREDRELVGLLAAGLAYGQVTLIRRNLEELLRRVGPRPSAFLEAYQPRRDARRFDGFVHRFSRGRDVALMLWLVRQARERFGGLERLFLAGDEGADGGTLEQAMDRFGDRLFDLSPGPFYPGPRIPRRAGVRWLLPLPAGGSVCKRHCLFLRWMVRPDDGVDCGVWTGLSPARLVLPLDVHLLRIARALGWTRRRSPSWKMAVEVTGWLRRLDPSDPTRYDFALSRLGILGLLDSRRGTRADRLAEVLQDVAGKEVGET
jgi:uncharacterized protein (TIGR02757 family)